MSSWAADHDWWVLVGLLHPQGPLPKEGNPTLRLQPELGKPTKGLKRRRGAQHCLWKQEKAHEHLQPSHRRGQKINPCYRGFNKRWFDIVHHKPSVLMSISSSRASRQWSRSCWWGWQPCPQMVILLLGTGAQTLCGLRQLLAEPKRSAGCPKSQKPGGFQCLPHRPCSPAGAAPVGSATVSTGPSGEQPLALPLPTDGLSGRDSRRRWLSLGWTHRRTPALPWSTGRSAEHRPLAGTPPEPGGSRRVDLALVDMETCNKVFADRH